MSVQRMSIRVWSPSEVRRWSSLNVCRSTSIGVFGVRGSVLRSRVWSMSVCGKSTRVCGMSIRSLEYVDPEVCQSKKCVSSAEYSPKSVQSMSRVCQSEACQSTSRSISGYASISNLGSMSIRGEVGQCNANQEYVTPSASIGVVGS